MKECIRAFCWSKWQAGSSSGSAQQLREQMEHNCSLQRCRSRADDHSPLADDAKRRAVALSSYASFAIAQRFHIDLPSFRCMTQDFLIAVEEGATLVRVGTAIFGERSN
jgi:hypothetical protein